MDDCGSWVSIYTLYVGIYSVFVHIDTSFPLYRVVVYKVGICPQLPVKPAHFYISTRLSTHLVRRDPGLLSSNVPGLAVGLASLTPKTEPQIRIFFLCLGDIIFLMITSALTHSSVFASFCF